MFRKPFATKTESQLRSSDRRKLRAELQTAYPASTEERIADLFGEGGGGGADVTSVKFTAHSGEQGLLISAKGQPIIWKDLDGNLFPTVYALWKIPNMLPTITTHGPVLQKLFDGADLMLPGVIVPADGFGELKVGDIVSITIRGSLMPMAVGTMAISSDEIKSSDYAMRGKGVHILHTFGDTLWAAGDKSNPPDPIDEADTSGSWSEISYPQSGMSTPVNVDVVTDSVRSLALSNKADDGGKPVLEDMGDEDESASGPQLTPAEMDDLLEVALMTAIKTSIPEDAKSLPIPSSVLYSNHIMPCRPRGTHLDIKHSSYKKVGKFLKAMERRGLIKLKERGGETLLMSVNRQHPLLKEFETPRKVARDDKKKDAQPAGLAGAGGSATGTGLAAASSAERTLSIVEFYKPAAKELRFFEEVGGSKNAVYSAADIRTAVTEYITAKNLVDTVNPRMVKIDPILCDAVLKKEEYSSVDFLPRDAIVQRLKDQMHPFHELHTPHQAPTLRKGALKPLQITTEQRQGRKMVTKIVGMERLGVDPEELMARLKVRCASSTALTPVTSGKPSAPATYEIMVQGSKVKEICAVLETDYGFPPMASAGRFVEVLDKSKKKG